MSEHLKLDMTVDEALAFAEEWTRGMTLHAGSQGWRVVCLLLGEEVKALREENERLMGTFINLADKLGIDLEAAKSAPGKPSDVFYAPYAALESQLAASEERCHYWHGEAIVAQGERKKLSDQLAELRQGGEAVAYLTLNECGDPAMLFFDQAEAATYCSEGVDSIPLYTCPQPAIPPGYVVVKSELFEAVAALVRFAGDWNQGTHAKLYRPVICRLVGEHISNAPAIQSQAAAPSVPVAEKALPENVKLLLLKAHRQLETEYRQQTRATEAKRVANATCGESPGGASSIALLAESGYISSIGKRNQEVRDEIFAMLAAPADSKEGE